MSTTIMDIVDRMVETVLNILPDREPEILFTEYEGDVQPGNAMTKTDPAAASRVFSVVCDSGVRFDGFNGDRSTTESSVVVIVQYVCPGRGGFKRARKLMGADVARIAHEMIAPTITGGFASIGNPLIDIESADMSQVAESALHILTATFRVRYPLSANQ